MIYNSLENLPKTKKRLNVEFLKSKRFISITAAMIIIIVGLIITLAINSGSDMKYQAILKVDEIYGTPDENWSVSTAKHGIATAEFKTDMGFPGYSLVVEFHKPGETDLVVKTGDGQEINYIVSINKNEEIEILQR